MGTMLPACFPKAEKPDSQDPAHCGPIQVPAGEQDHPHCDQPVDPHVDQHRRRAKHAQIVAGGPAAGLEQAAVTRPGRPDRLPAEKQAGKDGCYAHRPQQPAEQSVVPCGPEVRDLRLRPEGAHQGHQQHGHQPAGKPYIVQVHPVLDLVCIGGQRGHYKADHQAGRHPKHRGAPAVVQDDIADDRPQGRGQQGHGRILSKGLLSALSVQPSPQDDGPGVDRVLPKQENPAINPTTTSVKPLAGSPELRRISTERAVTTEELIRAAPRRPAGHSQ